ncbi:MULTISPECIES: polysaccharide deacetylase family protein [unclassified Nocardioides]|uniref:polysaccharide deacetylase family protein n=1 Tax=unclassified Nocardioides TaxID=2615069 RepID=UPI0000571645|nr:MULTISPECIES: polysaccharide deacetylase family protein [unclassified Nocardioides]ABL81566.1 polysaccharide deacetylase [Nocardioides sp. JS614]
MRGARIATLATLSAAGAWAGPAATAIGPLRRPVLPLLSGIGPSLHVALTYDDGPDPESTPHVLDVLARHGRRATFFVVGEQVRASAAILRRMVAEGHEVAVHGWTHRCVALVPPTRLVHQLAAARTVVEDTTGVSPTWYRPPYGVLTGDAIRACRTLGLTPVLWSAWGRDWIRRTTPERIVATVLATLRPGGTVLLHDTDRHARGDWGPTLAATDLLLSGALAEADVGPLAEHGISREPAPARRVPVGRFAG